MIFELAKELEMGALDLVDGLKAMGLNVRNHMSPLSDEDVQKAMARFQKGGKQSSSSTSAKKKVVAKKEVATISAAPMVAAVTTAVVPSPTLRKKAVSKVTPVSPSIDKEESVTAQLQIPDLELSANIDQNIVETEINGPVAPVVLEENTENLEALNIPETETLNQDNQMAQAAPQEAGTSKIVTVKKRSVVLRRKVETPTVFEPTQTPSVEEMHKVDSESKMPGITPHKSPSAKNMDEEIPKLRGLQVVFRPEKTVAPVVAENPAKQDSKTAAGSGNGNGNNDQKGKKKEFLEVKMHSFTPVYIPPKPAPGTAATTSTQSRGSETTRRVPYGARGGATGTLGGSGAASDRRATAGAATPGANPVRTTPLTPEEILAKEDALKLDSKKRLGGLAAMVAKPKIPKTRDIVQFRADEELKVYSQGVIGKVSYTNVGRKKVFLGMGKSTEITEIKDSKRILPVHDGIEAKELANRLGIKFSELQEKVLEINLLIRPNDYFGIKLLTDIALLFRYKVINRAFQEEMVIERKEKIKDVDEESKVEDNRPVRPPVVAVMGHVDHGKTTLLDSIRNAKVAHSEAGGITQHLGAYTVEKDGKSLTFIDTPGHAAFSAMRERGAKATDIVVLVVAADDGVMPQTRESIKFCKNNNVPIVVAINKMDKEGLNPDRIMQDLTEFQLVPEDWGGDTQYVRVSALKSQGIDDLLDALLLQAEILELKADPKAKATGVVLESKIESGRGPVCTLLVQEGTLHKGDSIIVGESYGRARSILDQNGEQLNSAGPSFAVQIIGLDSPPSPGEQFDIVKSEREAKKVAENRIEKRKQLEVKPAEKIASLEDFFKQQGVSSKEQKQILKVILRSDVMGSYEALKNALGTLGNNDVGVEIIAGGAGPVTDGDVNLAKSSKGLILAFNVAAVTSARRLSENLGIEIRSYRIIYDLINDVKLALEGLLAPVKEEKYIGRAQIREIFTIPKIGVIAGCVVQDGKVEKGCQLRVIRDGKIVHEGKIDSLKRFKDSVKEVKSGHECGISVENFSDLKVQDIFEAFILEEKKRTLEVSVMEARL